MVSRFLITTPQKNTWKFSEPILFLGEWCKLYKKKEYVITSGCWDKCNETKNDLFNLVKSIKF